MFKKILIVGCGLIGSSILRGAIDKKLSKIQLTSEDKKINSFLENDLTLPGITQS